MHKQTVLFLQLPSLDNDVRGARENLSLAGAYLNHALLRSAESRRFAGSFLPAVSDELDNAGLVNLIRQRQPSVLVLTLYLWNIERSLRIARLLRLALPDLRILAGGPEVARRHPFLFAARVADGICVGEGEAVFPAMLAALCTGRPPDFSSVAWRTRRGYRWGRQPAPPVRLQDALPPPDAEWVRPDARGVAYLETTRGCPMRCTFCRYHHLRHGVSLLNPAQVSRRIGALVRRGAREFKFMDPTFNAHRQFEDVLQAVAGANPRRKLKFFAELRADTITERQAELLAVGGFVEIEVGMQSRDPEVLRRIRRATRLDALEAGVRRLTRRGIRVTLDVMYGLPGQPQSDVLDSLRWALRLPRVRVQGMQTLLLPGTDMREDAARWGMKSTPRPPYGVTATAAMTREQVREIETFIENTPGLPSDAPTARFVGSYLPDLFPERVVWDGGRVAGGSANRRAVLFRGAGLFAARGEISAFLRRAVRGDPDMLWQFVLCPRHEEPLDLLDTLVAELRRCRPHLLDCYAGPALSGRLVSRRILVQLPRRGRFSPSWIDDAESVLRAAFY